MIPEKITIREFNRNDAKDIVKLHSESSENFEEQEITEDFILNIANRNDFRFFIITLSGKVIGFIGVLFHVNVGRAEIGPICIRSIHRGRGIGTRLLNHAMEFLRQRGIRRVIVRIKSENTGALRFFRKNGFIEEGYFREYTRKGEDVIQLRRFI
ncbi:MAG: hypothetical protein DRO89_04790 [Candidatus Altiarchaeales archaeon]|nr:MAG: hypothetical protein DRO89_04790 [Candidatus Altiarchaeales archaeon]